jgi:hypothetical protein
VPPEKKTSSEIAADERLQKSNFSPLFARDELVRHEASTD